MIQPFLDNFTTLTETPNAILKIRELLLRLAVRGKLVEQVRSEEPACALIEKIRKITGVSPLLIENPPYYIPKSWSWIRFGDLVKFEIGRTPNTKVSAYWEMDGNGIPWVSIGDMPSVGFIESTVKRVTDRAVSEVFKRPPTPCGTLLMSFKLSIGKLAFLNMDAYHNEAIISIFPVLPEVTRYLFYCLRAIDLFTGSKNAIKGSTLNSTSLQDLLIPLPPLKEQERIVNRLEALMRLCDELEPLQKVKRQSRVLLNDAAIAPLKRAATLTSEEFEQAVLNLAEHFDTLYDSVETVSKLRSTILQLAVQGKLVPQYAADECAANLLFKNQKKRARLTRSGTSQSQRQLSEHPFPIPSNWQWVPLAELGIFLGGGTPSKSNPAFWKGDIPWISPKDVKRLYIADAKDHISELALQQTTLRRIPSGSLLMVVRGMILAHSFPVALSRAEVTINQDMKALVFALPEVSEYVLLACRGLKDLMLSKVARSTHGTCRLETSAIELFPIPIPPLEEQKRIVAKVNQLIALCDDLEAKLRQAEAGGEKLMDAAVKHVLDVVAGKNESQRESALALTST